MAYQKKCYRSSPKGTDNRYMSPSGKHNVHQSRGGASGKSVDTGFGAPGNLRLSRKRYKGATAAN